MKFPISQKPYGYSNFLIAAVAIIVIVAINLYNRLVTLQIVTKMHMSPAYEFAIWIYPIKMTAAVAQQG